MIILALDTSTRIGSIALLSGSDIIEEFTGDSLQSWTERLPGDLNGLLERNRLDISLVSLCAVTVGPGSFTGLRVGIATMQGLAFSRKLPLIGISALDALAKVGATDDLGLVVTWINAWRGEVFGALYKDGQEVLPPTVGSPETFLKSLREKLKDGFSKVCFVGDGVQNYESLIRDKLGGDTCIADPVSPPLAGVVGKLALGMFREGLVATPDSIRPLYVRRPDAEVSQERREKPRKKL